MTILKLIQERAHESPDAVAIQAPGRPPLTYKSLHDHVVRTAAVLQRHGIGREDAVAVVVPNGPDMATAFLSVATVAVCAPLNPAYRADEFEFYFTDLPARALLISGMPDSPARDVARKSGIPIIEITWSESDAAGLFAVEDSLDDKSRESLKSPSAGDVALILHTSGTTSRPKIVPLTHANLVASATHISATLQLTSNDVCLNVMPLFHIHGLIGALLSSLKSGAGVVCSPGFLATSFFAWMEEFRPTWYTAVPTMHASVLSRSASAGTAIQSHNLRFIRSSSSALPRTVLDKLESTFRVPVVEAYGMTEAAHQMASNPLPPRERKPGTVGPQAGPSISVIDGNGNAVPAGTRGEVAIRGPNVTKGYARNETANAAAFVNGWLRTGDEGTLDEDGYLSILGRLKEVINRGGEKISPLEVDEVILAHPSVAQAVTFAARDAVLGEEVAAAVVLREGADLSERQLREFVAARLAYFKVPRRVLFMSAVPTGPTGKVQRIGLGDRLGVSFDAPSQAAGEHVAPRSPVEEILASLWSSVLGTDSPSVHDDFFFAGGDSMLAAQFISGVQDTLAVEISLLSFFDAPTIADVGLIVEDLLAGDSVDSQIDGAAVTNS